MWIYLQVGYYYLRQKISACMRRFQGQETRSEHSMSTLLTNSEPEVKKKMRRPDE